MVTTCVCQNFKNTILLQVERIDFLIPFRCYETEMNLEANKHPQSFLNEVLRRYKAPKLTKITKSKIEVPLW